MGKKSWTDERDEMLSDLRKKGVSAKVIADKINDAFGTEHTRNAILGRAFRIGSEKYKTKKEYKVADLPKNDFRGHLKIKDICFEGCLYMDDDLKACGKPRYKKDFCEEHYLICYPPNIQTKAKPDIYYDRMRKDYD